MSPHSPRPYNGWAKQVRQVIEAMDHTFRWGIYDRAPQDLVD
jgi:hypothetical protein